MEEDRKRWHKLVATGVALVTLLTGLLVVAFFPNTAGCFSAFAIAATSIVTAFVAGNVAEHGIYRSKNGNNGTNSAPNSGSGQPLNG
jgi:hypothetical protein